MELNLDLDAPVEMVRLKAVLEELGNKHLHPHQPCQGAQLDHENLQDPKEMEDAL